MFSRRWEAIRNESEALGPTFITFNCTKLSLAQTTSYQPFDKQTNTFIFINYSRENNSTHLVVKGNFQQREKKKKKIIQYFKILQMFLVC